MGPTSVVRRKSDPAGVLKLFSFLELLKNCIGSSSGSFLSARILPFEATQFSAEKILAFIKDAVGIMSKI